MAAPSDRPGIDALRLRDAGLPASFCPMPWVHAYADPRGDVRPCCWYDATLDGSPNLAGMASMDDVMNCHGMVATRAAFMDGQTPQACLGCRRREEEGQYSKRMKAMDSVSDDELRAMAVGDVSGVITSYSLRHFDFRFDNTCNFKCRTCGPVNSSRIEAEDRSQGLSPSTGGFDRSLWHHAFMSRIGDARTVYFAGGEPLIMESTYDVLEALVSTGNTAAAISCSTNLSQLSTHGRRILDLWRSFPDLTVSISLDHHGERAAYIRHGTDWDQIVANYRLLRTSCPDARIQIDCVVSVLNILDITEIVERFRMSFDHLPINLLPVMGKPHFDPANLPYDAKRVALARIGDWCNANPHDHDMVQRMRAVADRLDAQGRQDSPRKFLDHMARLDALRGESLREALPELAGFYQP